MLLSLSVVLGSLAVNLAAMGLAGHAVTRAFGVSGAKLPFRYPSRESYRRVSRWSLPATVLVHPLASYLCVAALFLPHFLHHEPAFRAATSALLQAWLEISGVVLDVVTLRFEANGLASIIADSVDPAGPTPARLWLLPFAAVSAWLWPLSLVVAFLTRPRKGGVGALTPSR